MHKKFVEQVSEEVASLKREKRQIQDRVTHEKAKEMRQRDERRRLETELDMLPPHLADWVRERNAEMRLTDSQAVGRDSEMQRQLKEI